MCRCSHPQQGSMQLNLLPFPSAVVARSHSQSATVFLLRLTFKNACVLSGQTMSQTFIMQFLTNSPSVKGRAALAISAAKIKLAFTAASLCDLAFTPAIFLNPLPSGASVSCPDVCTCLGVSFHSAVLSYILLLQPHRLHTQDKQVCPLHRYTYSAEDKYL